MNCIDEPTVICTICGEMMWSAADQPMVERWARELLWRHVATKHRIQLKIFMMAMVIRKASKI